MFYLSKNRTDQCKEQRAIRTNVFSTACTISSVQKSPRYNNSLPFIRQIILNNFKSNIVDSYDKPIIILIYWESILYEIRQSERHFKRGYTRQMTVSSQTCTHNRQCIHQFQLLVFTLYKNLSPRKSNSKWLFYGSWSICTKKCTTKRLWARSPAQMSNIS